MTYPKPGKREEGCNGCGEPAIKYPIFMEMKPSHWISFLANPNLFGIKGFVVVVIVVQFYF
jgi:hypothetical protein